MKIDTLNDTIAEAERFLKRAKSLRAELKAAEEKYNKLMRDQPRRYWTLHDPHITRAAVRRSSMDLTRSLAQLRKY